MDYYTMKIAGVTRSLPLCSVSDSVKIAALIILGDPELSEAAAQALLEKAPAYDYLITAESKGIPLAHDMARLAGHQKYVVARKSEKLYMPGALKVSVNSITTAKEQTLYLDMADAAMMKGKRILLVDDVISTGESLKSLEALVEQAGGEIVGRMFILAEGDAAKRSDVCYLERLPLFDKDGNVLPEYRD